VVCASPAQIAQIGFERISQIRTQSIVIDNVLYCIDRVIKLAAIEMPSGIVPIEIRKFGLRMLVPIDLFVRVEFKIRRAMQIGLGVLDQFPQIRRLREQKCGSAQQERCPTNE